MKNFVISICLLLLCSSAVLAAPARIVVSSDPEYFPPEHHLLKIGDSAQVSLERLALVYIEEHVKDKYYFKVYKNGRYLADVRPEVKRAIILLGDYRFEVFDLKDRYIGEVFVQTQVWTRKESIMGDILFVSIILLIMGLIVLIKRLSGYRARKRYIY